jgi:hypothetical protein
MRKLSAKRALQESNRLLASQAILKRFRLDLVGFSNSHKTMNKIWKFIRVYGPQIKDQSKERRYGGSLCPKKLKIPKSSGKKEEMLLVYYLGKFEKIMSKHYFELLDKLKQQLVSKR